MALDAKKEKKKQDRTTLKAIEDIAREVYDTAAKKKLPSVSMPVRALSNVTYDRKKGHFVIGKAKKTRTSSSSIPVA